MFVVQLWFEFRKERQGGSRVIIPTWIFPAGSVNHTQTHKKLPIAWSSKTFCSICCQRVRTLSEDFVFHGLKHQQTVTPAQSSDPNLCVCLRERDKQGKGWFVQGKNIHFRISETANRMWAGRFEVNIWKPKPPFNRIYEKLSRNVGKLSRFGLDWVSGWIQAQLIHCEMTSASLSPL